MFFSLIQTLICVLLVNGGLYAMHLTGMSNNQGLGGGGSGGGGGVDSLVLSQSHVGVSPSLTSSNKKPSSNPAVASQPLDASSSYANANARRLNEEIADLAQLERERLMLMGLAKQTAENTGHRGRPIITGRVKMHPVDDSPDASDYSSFLIPSSRNLMFGNVVRYPPQHPYNENPEDILEEYVEGDGGGGVGESDGSFGRTPLKYEYGRIMQPEEKEFENPHDLNLDEFMELKSVPDVDDMLPDSYDYAYLDELLAEDNKEKLHHHHQQQTQPHHFSQFSGFRQKPSIHRSSVSYNPPTKYQNREQTPQVLQEFFEKEQQQQEESRQKSSHLTPKYRDNMRMQSKWQLKRAQQLPRFIFGDASGRVREPQLAHNRLHTRFRQLHNNQHVNKLASTNSEATASSKLNIKFNNDNDIKKIDNAQLSAINDDDENSHNQSNIKKVTQDSAATSISSLPSSSNDVDNNKSIQQQQQQREHQEQILPHPNHKRSGLTTGAAVMPQQPPGTHSLASQLMLRTARGQRQYDVPQIVIAYESGLKAMLMTYFKDFLLSGKDS
uniref:Uncharacterized protein n=1 Tax=Glossina brevipalpis TaxID=37001 RepID=A0A1A9WQW8_9MUSC